MTQRQLHACKKRELKSLDCKLKIEMVASVVPKRGSCVFSHGGGGFRIAQCPQVSIAVRVLPVAGHTTWKHNDEKS